MLLSYSVTKTPKNAISDVMFLQILSIIGYSHKYYLYTLFSEIFIYLIRHIPGSVPLGSLLNQSHFFSV